jgi:hypothetical protein
MSQRYLEGQRENGHQSTSPIDGAEDHFIQERMLDVKESEEDVVDGVLERLQGRRVGTEAISTWLLHEPAASAVACACGDSTVDCECS